MLSVTLRPGSRPARLRAQVDASFLSFADRLPPLLRRLALDRRTFTGRAEAGPFLGPSQLNPVIAGAPWLFWRACRRLPDDRLLSIAEAGALLGAAYAIQDHLIDEQLPEPAGSALLAQACFERAWRILQRLFPPAPPFWSHFEFLWAELRWSQAAERQWQLEPAEISPADFRRAARAKAAPVVITLAALEEAGAQPALLETGGESLLEFGAAAQLIHDVGDWRDDVLTGHHTYFLSRAATPADLVAGRPALNQIQAGFHQSWLDFDCLRLAGDWLGAAERLGEQVACPAWCDYLRRCRGLLDEEFTRCLAGHVVGVATTANTPPSSSEQQSSPPGSPGTAPAWSGPGQ